VFSVLFVCVCVFTYFCLNIDITMYPRLAWNSWYLCLNLPLLSARNYPTPVQRFLREVWVTFPPADCDFFFKLSPVYLVHLGNHDIPEDMGRHPLGHTTEGSCMFLSLIKVEHEESMIGKWAIILHVPPTPCACTGGGRSLCLKYWKVPFP